MFQSSASQLPFQRMDSVTLACNELDKGWRRHKLQLSTTSTKSLLAKQSNEASWSPSLYIGQG